LKQTGNGGRVSPVRKGTTDGRSLVTKVAALVGGVTVGSSLVLMILQATLEKCKVTLA